MSERIQRVLVIGSGPIVIGQAAEFDYAGTQACRALREEGIETILVNSNPATIMTDEDVADVVYVEPLIPEVIRRVIMREKPDGLLPTLGGQTFKLKFGHRGANHPVKELESGRVEITSQNHGFAVDPGSLPADVAVTHLNLNDQTVEGFRHTAKPIFSVQYHPEASPGPHDADYLFRQFLESMEKR